MKENLKWIHIFNQEANLQAIALGERDLPEFPGEPGSPAKVLHQSVLAAVSLLRGDFDAASQLLAALPDGPAELCCTRICRIWLEAETADPAKALQNLSSALPDCRLPAAAILKDRLSRQAYRLDRRLSARWTPVLRYYLTTLLTAWTEEILLQAGQDREAAVAAKISEGILVRIDFLLRFAQARREQAVDKILAAVQDWQNLCQLHPQLGDGSEYSIEAALALEFDDRMPEALGYLELALQQNPDHYDLLLVKARILKETGEFAASLAICDRLISIFPDDFSGYCLRSNVHFLTGRYEQAMRDARKACEVAPANPNSILARAFVQMQLGHYEEALQDFEQALHYDPARYDALRGQGKCLSMLGRDFEALASFNALRRTYPDDPDLYYELADILFSAGYLDECEKVCRRCLELDNRFVSAMVILGMIAQRRNQESQARQLLTRAVDIEPDHPFALNELAYFNHLQGEDETALELVNRALEESPDYADALCNKGIILYYRSEFEQSAAEFEKTLQVVPDHVSALVGMGNALTQLCEFDEANRCYDRALQLDPDNAEACHGKAVYYRMIGLDDEVRMWQERAYLLDQDEEDG